MQLHALRRARTSVLFHLRRRRTVLHLLTRQFLRRAYNSRVRRVARYKLPASPAPRTRRYIKERMRRLKSYLQRRPRRLVRLKQVLARAVPERPVRRQLHRIVRQVSAALARNLPAPRRAHVSLRRGRELQNIIYTTRKKGSRQQYSKLYSKHTMAALGRARLAIVRLLRLERRRSQQAAHVRYLRRAHPRKAAARRARRIPRGQAPRRSRRRWFLRCLPRPLHTSLPLQAYRRGQGKRRPLPLRRAKLRYPRAVRRILRLQRANRRVKQRFKFRRICTGVRPQLRFVLSRQASTHKLSTRPRAYLGHPVRWAFAYGIVHRLLQRVMVAPSRPAALRKWLQAERVQTQLKTFVRQVQERAHTQPLHYWGARRLTRNLLAVSRRLQRGSHFARFVLRRPVYIRAVRRTRLVESH